MGNSPSFETNDPFLALIIDQLDRYHKDPKPYLFTPNSILIDPDVKPRIPLNKFLYSTKRIWDKEDGKKMIGGLFHIEPQFIKNSAEIVNLIKNNESKYNQDITNASKLDFIDFRNYALGRVAKTGIKGAETRVGQLFAGYESMIENYEYKFPTPAIIKENAKGLRDKYPYGFVTEVNDRERKNTNMVKELIECINNLSKKMTNINDQSIGFDDQNIDFDDLLDTVYRNQLIGKYVNDPINAPTIVLDWINILNSFIIPDNERWLNKIERIKDSIPKDFRIKDQFTEFDEFITKPEKTMRKLIRWIYNKLPNIDMKKSGGWNPFSSDSDKIIDFVLENKESIKSLSYNDVNDPSNRTYEQENKRLLNLLLNICRNTVLTDNEKKLLVDLINEINKRPINEKSSSSFYQLVKNMGLKLGGSISGGDIDSSNILNAIVVVILVLTIIYIFVVYGLGRSHMTGAIVSIVGLGLLHVTSNSLRCFTLSN